MYLLVDGQRIEVAACLENKCTLRNPRLLSPCHAELVIVVDGVERRKSVYLTSGISPDSDEIEFEPHTLAASAA